MRPLIVSATQEEIAKSIPFLNENNIDYLITGVGMVATTFALTRHLATHKYDYILNVGIAGAIDKSINIGTVVEVDTDILVELGAEDDQDFLTIDQLGFGTSTYSKITHTMLQTNLTTQTGITVNTVHGSDSSINRVKNLFPNATIESMEGAAFFYVAMQLNIPSIQIRSISNYVEKRNKTTWNIPLALINLNNWLISYLTKGY